MTVLTQSDDECATCPEMEGIEDKEAEVCPQSQRPCGHHCNCTWINDECHWCGWEVPNDGD